MRRSIGWLALALGTSLFHAHGFQAPTFRVTAVAPAPGAVLNAAPAEILISFSDTINASSVGATTVLLVRDGPDNTFGTPDDAVIVPAGITIQGGNQIRIDLTGVPLADDTYRVTVLGNTPISAGRVGWWKFDESSGTVAADASGNNHHGTLTGNPQWQPSGGRIGGALNFDGSGDWVRVTRTAALEPAGSLSVSLWANITSVTGGFADIVRKAGANQGGYLVRWHHFDDHLWWRLDRYSAPQIFLEDTQVNGAYLNGWHHIAGTWDAAAGVSRLYVDGVLKDAISGFTGTLEHTDDLFFMWSNHPGQVAIPGRLDDVRIYTRTLTLPEIQSLAAAVSDEAVTDLSGNPVDGEPGASFPSGNGAAGGDFTSTFLLNTAVPTAPSLLIAAPGAGGGIRLSWSDNSSTETGFRIERSTDGVTFAEIAVVGADVESYLDGGAVGSFFYRVRATNAAGNSGFSNASSATSTSAAPAVSIIVAGCGLIGIEIVLLALLRRRR